MNQAERKIAALVARKLWPAWAREVKGDYARLWLKSIEFIKAQTGYVWDLSPKRRESPSDYRRRISEWKAASWQFKTHQAIILSLVKDIKDPKDLLLSGGGILLGLASWYFWSH